MSRSKRIFFVYIGALHVFCAFLMFKSDLVPNSGPTPELSSFYKRMVEHHQLQDGSVPEGATVFIGDSITQGLATASVAELSINYGIDSDTTFGVLNRLPLYKSTKTAKAVVIAIGVNDLRRRDNDSIIANYDKIFSSFPAQQRVVSSAILPVDERVEYLSLSNQRITALNSDLKELARGYNNVFFFDPKDSMQDSEANLKAGFHVGDGIHLSTAGYVEWIKWLKLALQDSAHSN